MGDQSVSIQNEKKRVNDWGAQAERKRPCQKGRKKKERTGGDGESESEPNLGKQGGRDHERRWWATAHKHDDLEWGHGPGAAARIKREDRVSPGGETRCERKGKGKRRIHSEGEKRTVARRPRID